MKLISYFPVLAGGKFFGCMFTARLTTDLNWRESCTVGVLMNTKGLVELIVLNIGTQRVRVCVCE